MSIRDFDPLLKRAASKADRAGAQKAGTGSGTVQRPQTNIGVRPPSSIKPILGRQNIKVTETGSAAELQRGLIEAFKELSSNLDWYVDQLEGVLAEDCVAALEPTMELSQKYCPKSTLTLVNSAFLEAESFRGGARVVFGYARGNHPDYAIFVHEMPYQHAAPTSDKFLTRAVDEDYYNILQRVTDRVKVRVGGS